MALTLPSSKGKCLYFIKTEHDDDDDGQVTNVAHFNGGLTKTTSTLTPSRLKNIEEQFLEHQESLLPPKPFLHDHMAGFVPPNVNIKFHVKPTQQLIKTNSLNTTQNNGISLLLSNSTNSDSSKSIDNYSSNSNDSYSNQHFSDEYSSETNSSTFGYSNNQQHNLRLKTNNFTFSNQFVDSNGTATNMRNSTTSNMATRSKTKANASNSKSEQSTRSSSQPTKKSTGGGRKPNPNYNSTPEENAKRQKRRERNKLAAARCRKKKVDLTNSLIDQTRDLQMKNENLLKEIKSQLKRFYILRDTLESHESNCRQIKLHCTDLYSGIDEMAIKVAMEPISNDGFEGDFNTTNIGSPSADESSQNISSSSVSSPPKKKLKRPNSLPIRPMSIQSSNIDSQNRNCLNLQMNNNNSNDSLSTNNNSNLMVTTPSNGFFDLGFEPTGLTPLNPTLTSVDLTPSTMSAFLKSLSSPMEDGERKKILSM